MDELTVIGEKVPRVDARVKVTGKAVYVDDVYLPGMLKGKILRSPYPHARIIRIDTSQAEQVTGVRAVITAKDVPDACYGACYLDQPMLAREKVRYVGDNVAAVAADDEETALEACNLIEVEYEELPALFDPIDAMASDAPLIHERLAEYDLLLPLARLVENSNIHNHFQLRKGNMEKAFQEADLVVENRFIAPMIQHCYLEPFGAVVNIDGQGNLTCWASTQGIRWMQRSLHDLLRIDRSKIRIIVPYVGGGFGGKGDIGAAAICAALAQKTGRPVKIIFSREEIFLSGNNRVPVITCLKDGVKKDGTFLAREVKVIMDSGAYSGMTSMIVTNAGFGASGPYDIPNVKIDAYGVYTNNVPGSAFRGFGTPEIEWALESNMDIIAEKLGIDRVTIRLKNAYKNGSISATGEKLQSVGLEETISKATQAAEFQKPAGLPARGKGIASAHKYSMAPGAACAYVEVKIDGSLELRQAVVELGQGSNTVLAQMVAEEFKVPLDKVTVALNDTTTTPFDLMTGSSRATYNMGNAVRLACEDARRQVRDRAAEILEARADDLIVENGTVFVQGVPEKFIPFRKLFAHGGYPLLIGSGTFNQTARTVDLETGQSERPCAFWMYSTQCTEVEVDEETGQVRVMGFTAAHDVGKAINPDLVKGQIVGGVVQGQSIALMEKVEMENGRILNANFLDYKVGTVNETPGYITPIIVEEAHPEGPYGAKGVGEGVLAPTAAALGNAVYDAVGVRIYDLPLTPEKIYMALKKR